MMKYIALSRLLHGLQEQARNKDQRDVSDRQPSPNHSPSIARRDASARASR